MGFSLEGIDTFRGAKLPGGIADCGEGYDFAVTNPGRPGCEEERVRFVLMPKLAMVLAGSDAGPVSSGDEEPLRVDAFLR